VAAGLIKTCIGKLKYEVFGHSGNDNGTLYNILYENKDLYRYTKILSIWPP